MNILLIGGSGFVSGTTARLAVAQGHRVWAVTRGQRPLPDGVIGVQADRRERTGFAAAMDDLDMSWDLVVDCIGYEPEDAEQDLAVFRERAAHFVFISTDFIYDPARRRFPQPEDDADYLSHGYGGRKRQCELRFIEGDTGAMNWTILRPCHIYGPGSLLGCLPEHSRDPQLLQRLRQGEPLRLVGGGHFLQQPIFAADLAHVILACGGNRQAHGAVCNVAGPDIIESWTYYQILADELGAELHVEELPVAGYLAAHPERTSFLCHRIYALDALQQAGLPLPATRIRAGLSEHLAWLLAEGSKP